MQLRRRLSGFALAIVVALVAAACGTASTAGGGDQRGLTKLRLGLSNLAPGPEHASLTIPQALDYWKEMGLDVEYVLLAGGAATAQALDAGQIDIAMANGLVYVRAGAQGADLQAIYTYVTKDFTQPFQAIAGHGVATPADLAGKRVGVQSLESGAIPVLRAMAARAGLSDSDFEVVPIGSGAEAIEAARRGAVDVLAMWDVAYREMRDAGVPLQPINDEFFDSLGFSLVYGARGDYIAENPKVIDAFGRGLAMGSEFVSTNPEAAVRLHWEVFPDSRPTGLSEEEALAKAVDLLELRWQSAQPVAGKWGYSSPEQVQSAIEVWRRAEARSGDKGIVEPSAVWTDRFVDAFNEFDRVKVQEQARNYK